MVYAIIGLAIVAIIYGPQLWISWVLKRHGSERRDYPGNGGELARHLLDKAGLHGVRVEHSRDGDHYDPVDKVVRLTRQHYNARSLSAVAIAAHEVGHAVQDAQGYKPLHWRTRLVTWLAPIEMIGSTFLSIAPLILVFVRSPMVAGLSIATGVGLLFLAVTVHLVTLPMEFNASFGRALPMLENGRYLSRQDMKGARSVLRAAALTYVAAALVNLLNIWRLFRLLR